MSSIFGGGHSSQEGAFGIGAYEEADDEEVYSTDNLDISHSLLLLILLLCLSPLFRFDFGKICMIGSCLMVL